MYIIVYHRPSHSLRCTDEKLGVMGRRELSFANRNIVALTHAGVHVIP